MLLIGIDLSLRSPGIAVFDTSIHNSEAWHIYAFTQTTTKHKIENNKHIKLLSPIPSCDNEIDLKRYRYIVDSIVKIIQESQTNHKDVRVAIEGYAFSKNKSGHTFKLYELTGILKMAIFEKCQISCRIIAITQWKRLVTGKSFAEKVDIVNFMKSNGPTFDFLEIMQYHDVGNEIPNPVQDMADACGIAIAFHKLIEIEKKHPLKSNVKKSVKKSVKKPPQKRKNIIMSPSKKKGKKNQTITEQLNLENVFDMF